MNERKLFLIYSLINRKTELTRKVCTLRGLVESFINHIYSNRGKRASERALSSESNSDLRKLPKEYPSEGKKSFFFR